MNKKITALGPLEMEVLGLLKGKSPMGVFEIQNELKKNGKDLAYTTVMTILVRLYNKDVLFREKEGRQFLYGCKDISKIGKNLLSKVRNSLFKNDSLNPILALLENNDEITSEELKELRSIIDEKLKEKKNG